jgi:hypothetical protein
MTRIVKFFRFNFQNASTVLIISLWFFVVLPYIWAILDWNSSSKLLHTPFCLQHSFILPWCNSPQWARTSSLPRIHDRIQLHAPQLVGLLWMSDQFDAEPSTWHTTLKKTDILALDGIRNHNPARERTQTHALDLAVTGIGLQHFSPPKSGVGIFFSRCRWRCGGQAFCTSSRADWVSDPCVIDLSSLTCDYYLWEYPHLIVWDLIRSDATVDGVVQHETASLVLVCFQFLKLVWWQSCRTEFFLFLRFILPTQYLIHTILNIFTQENYIFFPKALWPNPGHGLLILEISRSHTSTHNSR